MGGKDDLRLRCVTDLSCRFTVAVRKGERTLNVLSHMLRTCLKEVCEARVRINRHGVARAVVTDSSTHDLPQTSLNCSKA